MKRSIPVLLLMLCLSYFTSAQITSPVIRANFGVDADLRANFFNSFLNNGNDDWFRNNNGTGDFIIDTTGAAFILNKYATDANFRKLPFFRSMRHPQFSIINNRMLIDGIFIRDYHGDDSTVFASGSNKNGMSPASWTCPVSQGIPDKNEILDIMMHVRREGPNITDSLWMFGGVSIDNIQGNRYFDFEMYQTDIYYDRTARKFFGFGPDAGHTAWQFDASGNITRPGDVIFTAEYGSSSLTQLEARIWIHQSALSITPADFNWGTEFDGDGNGSQYGYANILPKTGGTFYTGLQSSNNTWAGPFSVVLQNNSVVTTYDSRQFMEFSVNLSKLGLDPLTTTGDACGMPFRRILVKTRASTSFTAELKDFVGPFDFFRAPRAAATADIPLYCGSTGVSSICVNNPLPTSLYTWRTPNGNIVGDTIGPCITANAPGLYIVSQQLMDSCGTSYARDTVEIILDTDCSVLRALLKDFKVTPAGGLAQLNWTVSNNQGTAYFEIERSTDAVQFSAVGKIKPQASDAYHHTDVIAGIGVDMAYYRLRIVDANGNSQYSKIIPVPLNGKFAPGMKLVPNPVSGPQAQLLLTSPENVTANISINSISGARLRSEKVHLQKGAAIINLDNLDNWQRGIYIVTVSMGENLFTEKLILVK